ncbi:hypothetical protein NDN08_001440 [Rhodosorus marinus]|uniref:Uncharacterized protein n=1 Tax=Rhodosorus marinus TaxID=101924 RepID=A0AAV8UQW5_9RHOD|nr:hypothetical protein NDN08_001440 [Rhodosorus marinus]
MKRLIQNEVVLEMHGVELLVDISKVGNLYIGKGCLLLMFIGELALRMSDIPSSGYILIARVGADVSKLDVHLFEKYAMQALHFSNP